MSLYSLKLLFATYLLERGRGLRFCYAVPKFMNLSQVWIRFMNFLNPWDVEVYKEGKLVFYCEEKTLEYDDFEGLIKDSTYNAISRHLHTAVKQFNSINPNHEKTNVMAVVNRNTLKNIHDLFISLTGYALLDNGKYIKIHKVGHRTVEDISQVDLFLWFDKEQ
ncbi:MAG TPA: hypothetical protein GX519_03395, partial [Thermoanaerobacterales bacterium]|nr:hypothetical protein [Thermoanaerobacterales bacterium]